MLLRRSLRYRSLRSMLGLLAAVSLMVAACGGDDGDFAVGGRAPDFSLGEASGERVALDDYQGRDVLLYFHMARAEDRFVQEFIQKKPRIWDSDEWYEKVGLPADDAGGMGYTIEQVAAFVPPDLKKMQDYAAAVRDKTNGYLDGMTDTKFDEKITIPRFGEVTVANVWTIILSHLRQHSGEISYLRGLQRGINK